MKKHLLVPVAALVIFAACKTGTAEPKKDDGFKPLFNGKDFAGWYIISGNSKRNEDPNHLFQIHDGMVHMYKDAADKSKQPHGYICTEQEFSNYHFRFQYKWGTKKFGGKVNAKRDCGLLYHVYGPDGVWPKSVECQVQEGDTGDIFTVSTRVTTTVDPLTTNATATLITNEQTKVVTTNSTQRPRFKPASEGGVQVTQGVSQGIRRVMHKDGDYEVDGWNTVEVICRGDSAIHIVNGKTNNAVLHAEYFVDGKWQPLTKGKLLLQQEGAEVMYRNIEIKMLGDQ